MRVSSESGLDACSGYSSGLILVYSISYRYLHVWTCFKHIRGIVADCRVALRLSLVCRYCCSVSRDPHLLKRYDCVVHPETKLLACGEYKHHTYALARICCMSVAVSETRYPLKALSLL